MYASILVVADCRVGSVDCRVGSVDCRFIHKQTSIVWRGRFESDDLPSGGVVHMHFDAQSTAPRKILWKVTRGSVLGPLLFTLYTAHIGLIIQTYALLNLVVYSNNKKKLLS